MMAEERTEQKYQGVIIRDGKPVFYSANEHGRFLIDLKKSVGDGFYWTEKEMSKEDLISKLNATKHKQGLDILGGC